MRNVYSQEYKAFLKKLKAARIGAKITQVHAARLLKKPQSFISKAESGERRLDIIEVTYFAKLYKKPIGFFVD